MTETRMSENRPTTQQRRRRSSANGKNKAELPKPKPTTRTGDENKERAYVAASRRSDRSIEDRMKSAQAASDIHRQRTGKGLKITREAVENELMFEEEDDKSRPSLNGHPCHNASGISMAHEEQVNQQFDEVFGKIVRAKFPGTPWPSHQAVPYPHYQHPHYATHYNTHFASPMLPQFAQPNLGMVSQPTPISPIEVTEPYAPLITLPTRHVKPEFSPPPTVTREPASLTPISNTLSHPYNSASASPSHAAFDSNANRQSKRKSISTDPVMHPSINRPMKRTSTSSTADSPSLSKDSTPILSHSPGSIGAFSDEPDRPMKRRSLSMEYVDQELAGVPVIAPSPEMSTLPQNALFYYYTMDSPGGEMGEAEYLDPDFVKTSITSEHFEWPVDPVYWDDYINLDEAVPADAGSILDKSPAQAA